MSDDTTTDKSVDNSQPQESSQDDGQAEGTIQASAESRRTDQSTPSADGSDEPDNTKTEPEASAEDNSTENKQDDTTEDAQNQPDTASDDEDPEVAELQEWANKKGLDTSDPTKLLKAYREAEKRMHDVTTGQSELKNELSKTNDEYSANEYEPVIQEARVLNFYNSNPEARQYDKEMGQIYARFQKSDPEFAQHLSRHLDTLLAMAKTENGSSEAQKVQEARQQGKSEAFEKTKKAQAASAPKANAVQSQPEETGWTPEKVDKAIQNGEYSKYRDEILAWERNQLYGIN